MFIPTRSKDAEMLIMSVCCFSDPYQVILTTASVQIPKLPQSPGVFSDKTREKNEGKQDNVEAGILKFTFRKIYS